MIDHPRLLELLDYCPTTGIFTRKVSLTPTVKVGDVAGNLNRGYIELSVDGHTYRAHQLAWFYVYGKWPATELDHRDLDKSNNSIANLREATDSENQGNSPMRKNNTTGFKGVVAHGKKFKSTIMVNRKRLHLGVFKTAEEAAIAYDKAAITHFGEFALTNKKLCLL